MRQIQLRLYAYLASDLLSNAQYVQCLRRTSIVIQMMHALKYYYWLVDPRARSGYTPKLSGVHVPWIARALIL
jgi:hypothetical protein